ncbi:MAG: hypothetical protein Q8R88_08100 [Desulfoprunum sp.]|nr:hypothetical protein [Desulfoprunum sp.]
MGIEIAIEIAIGIGFSLLVYCIPNRSRVFLSNCHDFCGLDPDFDPDFDNDENFAATKHMENFYDAIICDIFRRP